MEPMTPREIVHELDKHIVGQAQAKRAVAIALRNRWRRAQVDAVVHRPYRYQVCSRFAAGPRRPRALTSGSHVGERCPTIR